MSKNVAVFVDVANLYYSARGQDVDVDYVALLKAATKGRDLIRAYAYSGLDPENENQRKFIDFLGKNGYKVLTKDIRKFGDGRVKANLDIELVVDLFRLADRMDIAVIVSGDGDFAPAIRALQDQGVRCEVISFRPNTSSDLLAVTDEFIDIMKIAGIGRNSKEAKAQRGMSAPEMPAKEVTPEFGFREASPTVAKAALAALREGGRDAGGSDGARTRRRGRSAASERAAAAEATEASASPVSDDDAGGDGELRKRRRRRGGRGRGRGRSRAEQPAAEEGAAEGGRDIGWVELDDVSQLAEVEELGDLDAEREYLFEEADAATLAELGLSAEDTGKSAVTEAEPKKPARRRTRTKKEAPAAVGETSPTDGPGGADSAGESAAEKPRRTTRRKSPAASAGTRRRAKADDEASGDADAAGSTERAASPAAGRKRSTTRSRTASRKSSEEAAPKETKKTTTRRTRGATRAESADAPDSTAEATLTRDAAPAGPADAGAEGDAASEGIWQRFRMGRSARQTT